MLGAAESVLLPCCVLTVLTPPDQPCAPAGCVLPAVLAHRAPGSLPSSMPAGPCPGDCLELTTAHRPCATRAAGIKSNPHRTHVEQGP